MPKRPTFGSEGQDANDFPHDVVRFARKVARDDQIVDAGTLVEVRVREADTDVGAEVYVLEHGNAGREFDDSTVPPRIIGDGSPVSKRVQDIAREFFDHHDAYSVEQYEDTTRSETTVVPTDLPTQAVPA